MAEIYDSISEEQFYAALAGKANADHVHGQYVTLTNADGRYYQKGEVDTQIGNLAAVVAGKADAVHPHALTSLSDMSEVAPIDGQVPRWDAASGQWVYSFEVAAVSEGDINLGGTNTEPSYKVGSIVAPGTEYYFQAFRPNLNTLPCAAVFPGANGMVVGSDQYVVFVETDADQIIGWMDLNTSTFRWVGPMAANELQENGQSLSVRYLGKTANAVSASKLATARSITLTGGATGTVEFDGSGNVSLPVTITNDSHAHTMANITGLDDALATKLDKAGGELSGDLEMGTYRVKGQPTAGNLYYYQPLRTDLGAMANSAEVVLGSATGSVIGSDGALVFAETDGDYVTGFMDMNTATFRWYGPFNANSIKEGGVALSTKYLGAGATAVAAAKLATPRTITLSGDASGSASFDGTGNINISVAVGALYGTRVTATENYAAVAGQSVAVDCTAASVTITAPVGPAENDIFEVGDAWGASETNNITVDFGAETFMGAAEDFIIDVNGYVQKFRFLGGTWRLWHG